LAAAEILLLVVVIAFTQKLSKQGAPVFNLSAVAQNNATSASAIPYHKGIGGYPHDLYVVLFDPTIFTAHSTGQRIAALENGTILVLILFSLRRLWRIPRAALIRPYVMAALLDVAGFCYAFAALVNLGLIDRERVLVLPFLLVLLSVPISPRGSPPRYPWEHPRRAQGQQRRPAWNYAGRR
jgi:hypothetical protein